MNRYVIDINKKYGMLTPIRVSRVTPKNKYWLCRCDCGNETEVMQSELGSFVVISCGCMCGKVCENLEPTEEIIKGRILKKYRKLFDKCKRAPYCLKYDIKVCDEWADKEKGFETFYKWCIENGYEIGLTIDRIDTYGDYCPSNCRFIDKKGQCRNRTITVKLTINGEEKPLSEWCEIFEVNLKLAYKRYRKGYSIEDIFYKGKFDNKGKRIGL